LIEDSNSKWNNSSKNGKKFIKSGRNGKNKNGSQIKEENNKVSIVGSFAKNP